MTGKVFGRLTVTPHYESRLDKAGRPHLYWLCKCECGNTHWTMAQSLRAGRIRSCGCWTKDLIREDTIERKAWLNANQASLVHGQAINGTTTKAYNAWKSMRRRCYNPTLPQYKDWGGRGIKVCPEWRDDFAAFYAYIGDPPTSHHTIDRKDNDGNYEPGNVRWATRYEQTHNRRRK